MPVKPTVGSAAGQQYPVLRSIQKFLQQMLEGGAHPASTVIKEILQNADDARAIKLAVILDERRAPTQLAKEYADLAGPAIIFRNDAPFRLTGEDSHDEPKRFLFCSRRNWTFALDRLSHSREGKIGRGKKTEELFSAGQGTDFEAASC